MHCVSMGLLLRGGFHWGLISKSNLTTGDLPLKLHGDLPLKLHVIDDKTESAVSPQRHKILITFDLMDQFKQMRQKNNHNKKCSFLM